MSTTVSRLSAGDRFLAAKALTVLFWTIALALLPVAELEGEMEIYVIGLSVGLAVIVWFKPQEAPGAGMLYLFAANIILPYASRFDIRVQYQEMYYWAVGAFIVTLSAVLRIGVVRVFTIPASAKAFLSVGVASAVYSLIQGAEVSYVLRQFYGILLLILYFGIALHAGDQSLLLRRIGTFGVLCAFFFFVYYIAVFDLYGFHKEMGFSGTQASLMAIPLFIAGFERRRWRWIVGGIVLLFVPILIFARKDVLTFILALPVAVALKVKSRPLRIFSSLIIVVAAVVMLFPSVAEIAGDELMSIPMVAEIIPEGARDTASLIGRTEQLSAIIDRLQQHPLLGNGLGSVFEWYNPSLGLTQGAFVDSGWGYVLQKMGLLGLAAFLWFLFTMFRGLSRESLALGISVCLVSEVLFTLYSEPVFFHFTTAPCLGAFAGLLFAQRRRGSLRSVSSTSQLRKPT